MMAILKKHQESLLIQLSAASHSMKILFTIPATLLLQIKPNSITNGNRFDFSIQRLFTNRKMKPCFLLTSKGMIKAGLNGTSKPSVNSEIFLQAPIHSV